ncbi:MAG: transposase [Bacteroidales bacterium]|nr:transposase [Bacteroidales bacterium]
MRTRFELAEVVNSFGAGLVVTTKLTPLQLKVLGKISDYRTAALGGHEETCQECYSHFGVETGAVCVLHSWGQNLSLHPHIHCIVPAAGYTLGGQWKNIGHSGSYLYPVHQMSVAFKGKFLDSLKRALRKQNELPLFDINVQQAYRSPWVVHCEPSMASAEHVVRYLGQYTHRVAITNQRILNIADGKVTFIAKDYRDRAIKKPVTLDGVEFLRRFTLHILPKRFVKIRRFGIYNHTAKRNLDLQFTPEEKPDIDTLIKRQQPPETNLQKLVRLMGINPCICPVCKTGRMVAIRELPRIRSPAGFLLKEPS